MTDVGDQTLEVLKRIQADIADVKSNTAANRDEIGELRASVERGFELLVPAVGRLNEALGDPSAQVAMLSRGVSVAMESRSRVEDRLDRFEQRLEKLEGQD